MCLNLNSCVGDKKRLEGVFGSVSLGDVWKKITAVTSGRDESFGTRLQHEFK